MSQPCPTFGFHVQIELAPTATALDRERFQSAWTLLLESAGLHCSSHSIDAGMFVSSEASQSADGDRTTVRKWLAARPELSRWSVGELMDFDSRADAS